MKGICRILGKGEPMKRELTLKQVEQIILDFCLDREPSIKGEEADRIRESLKRDAEMLDRIGGFFDIPDV